MNKREIAEKKRNAEIRIQECLIEFKQAKINELEDRDLADSLKSEQAKINLKKARLELEKIKLEEMKNYAPPSARHI